MSNETSNTNDQVQRVSDMPFLTELLQLHDLREAAAEQDAIAKAQIDALKAEIKARADYMQSVEDAIRAKAQEYLDERGKFADARLRDWLSARTTQKLEYDKAQALEACLAFQHEAYIIRKPSLDARKLRADLLKDKAPEGVEYTLTPETTIAVSTQLTTLADMVAWEKDNPGKSALERYSADDTGE